VGEDRRIEEVGGKEEDLPETRVERRVKVDRAGSNMIGEMIVDG